MAIKFPGLLYLLRARWRPCLPLSSLFWLLSRRMWQASCRIYFWLLRPFSGACRWSFSLSISWLFAANFKPHLSVFVSHQHGFSPYALLSALLPAFWGLLSFLPLPGPTLLARSSLLLANGMAGW